MYFITFMYPSASFSLLKKIIHLINKRNVKHIKSDSVCLAWSLHTNIRKMKAKILYDMIYI